MSKRIIAPLQLGRTAWNKDRCSTSLEGCGPDERRCTKCGKIKNLYTDFSLAYNNYGYRGRVSQCRSCVNAYQRKRRKTSEAYKSGVRRRNARIHARLRKIYHEANWPQIIRCPDKNFIGKRFSRYEFCRKYEEQWEDGTWFIDPRTGVTHKKIHGHFVPALVIGGVGRKGTGT